MKKGLTLIEILVSLAILSIGILALAQLFPVGLKSSERASQYTRRSTYFEDTIEKLRFGVSVYDGEDARELQKSILTGNPPNLNFDNKGYIEIWYRYRDEGDDSQSSMSPNATPFTEYFDTLTGERTAYSYLLFVEDSYFNKNVLLRGYITFYWKESSEEITFDTYPIIIANPYYKEWGNVIP